METNIKLIAAKTHPSEYLLHKYWARKPHNVISHFLSTLVPVGGTVVDPFCGSGVTLREAAVLGFNSYGFDINPIATLISSVTTNPPEVHEFIREVTSILDDLEQLGTSYWYDGDSSIRYLVHEIVVTCSGCGSEVSVGEAIKKGRIYNCPKCASKLSFNLENLSKTKITSIVLNNGRIIEDHEVIKQQETYSNTQLYSNIFEYQQSFVENRRILAFEGLTTSNLFTARNFSILCAMADRFHEINDDKIRNASLMMLTASVAQCSRLIPYRNNMTTGGPAWSVPGFWVPPQHLETNPFSHLRARLSKFERGLQEIITRSQKGTVKVENKDAVQGLTELREAGIKADLVFFDPPYGDSVPYLEFSTMWNSFLKKSTDVNNDISVSDRAPKATSWKSYRDSLNAVLREIALTLNSEGKLLITFNNHDLRAWEALFGALQRNNFECKFVTYQIPAVISSKAQFSPEGSYISDIYSVYKVNPDFKPTRSLAPVVDALKKCASSRDGMIAKNLALRVATVAWMQNNISVDLLPERENLISTLFKTEDGRLRWVGQLDSSIPKLTDEARRIAGEILQNGPCDWNKLYEDIASEVVDIGIPDPAELRLALEGYVIFDKKRCMAYHPTFEQIELPIEIFQ
jgi:DNA modification methylase/DNA-directed RNA polymerase subunit RPC12/RpoP